MRGLTPRTTADGPLVASSWRTALPALAWALGGVVLLLAYSPLHGKHLVILVPGLSLLAGAGCAPLGRWLASWSKLSLPNWLTPAAALALYLATLLPLLGQTGQLLRVTADTDVDPAFDQYSDAVEALRSLTTADEFVVTDQPYLPFLAERKVPPELVDTALARIRSRSLTASKAQTLAAAYDPKVVLLWGDRLRGLVAFKSWVEANYLVVKVYNRRGDTDRALYLRRDADFGAAWEALARDVARGPRATFAGELQLLGATIDLPEVAVGQGATVKMVWQLQQATTIDYHVLLDLRAIDGRSVDSQEESLAAGSVGTSQWEPGRWLVQNSFVLTEGLPPATYAVTVSVYDSRVRATIPIDGSDQTSLPLGSLVVR